jgi:membrane protein YqaA with SNARE-associated domain
MQELSLWALFVSAFISSTILPGGSEVLLGYLLTQPLYSPLELLAVASLGNTLGGMTSWGLGWLIAKRYPSQDLLKEKYQSALRKLQRWGVFALLFSWLPFIGDPLCVAAGWLRMNFFYSLLLIALGKTLRYGFIVWVVM